MNQFSAGLFQGKTALVTGGGTGIGFAICEAFASLGAKVAFCGRRSEILREAEERLARAHCAQPVYSAPCDIREAEQVADFVSATRAELGELDFLVNNAGGQFPSPAQAISANGFAAVTDNNLNGTFNVTREVANQSMIARGGRIVNITANVYRGFPGMAHTGAARAGVENLTKSLAVEWAKFGILVNAIAPGIVESSGTKQYPPALLKRAVEAIPLGRSGRVEEIAAAVVFLCSPLSAFTTGTTIRIDGGQSLYGDVWQI